MNFPHRYGINSVLLNEAGRHFLPSEFLLGVEPRPNGDTAQVWFTLDCGGADRGNLFCTACSESGAALGCRRDAAGRLTVMGSLGTRAAVLLDLDGDGGLDIVTNEFNGRPQVLFSDLAQRRRVNFLKVRLRGTRSNREGLGAEVTVVLPDGRRILKVCDGKSGYLSQSDLPLCFGLGAAHPDAEIGDARSRSHLSREDILEIGLRYGQQAGDQVDGVLGHVERRAAVGRRRRARHAHRDAEPPRVERERAAAGGERQHEDPRSQGGGTSHGTPGKKRGAPGTARPKASGSSGGCEPLTSRAAL